MTDPIHVLAIAPYCDGTDVGEAWSSHQWVKHLAERCQVTLLTQRKRNRPSAVGQLPGVMVQEWLDPPLAWRMERLNSMAKPGYPLFYRRARRWIRDHAPALGVEIIHQISPLALRYPSPAMGQPLPYVIGPLAGTLQTPRELARLVRRDPLYQRLRCIDRLRLRFDPWLRGTYAGAAAVVGVAPYVRELLPKAARDRFHIQAETGLAELPPLANRNPRQGRLRLLFVGRLVPTKGVAFALEALARMPDRSGITLDVIGTGRERARLEGRVQQLGLESVVRFLGRLPRHEVDTHYQNADAFLFPSVREPSGNVLYEALSHGLPVVTCQHGGPAHLVNSSCGFAIPPVGIHEFLERVAAAIRRLRDDIQLRIDMSSAARHRVRQVGDFRTKAAHMHGIYRQILGHTRREGTGQLQALRSGLRQTATG